MVVETAVATLQLNAPLGNYAGTKQKGGNVTATIDQNNPSQQNYATVFQNGAGTNDDDKNIGAINQSNTSTGNVGNIYQGYVGVRNPKRGGN